MRDDETGVTGSTTTPPDSSPAATPAPGAVAPGAVGPGAAHVVTEHDVRLALSSLGLEDRALTVHRATAFLTALGVTVTHAPLPATPWSADTDDAPTTVTVASEAAVAAAASGAAVAEAAAPDAADTETTEAADAEHVTPTEPSARDLVHSERSTAPGSRVTVRIPAGERDDDASVEGDIANLMEVLAHLQDHPPTPTPDELRARPRVAVPHAHPVRPSVRATIRRRSIA